MKDWTEKIGQGFMVGLKGEELSGDEKNLLATYPFGNFILFSHNLRNPTQMVSLCRSLWAECGEIPPFIAIDQEGGRVHRLPPPFTHFPAAALLGRTGDVQLAYELGIAVASELAAVGINLNLSPVLDVLSNPQNQVIGDRSLGSDPSRVSVLGRALVRGLRAGGIIPCCKHFPGHGSTERDSHSELPMVEKTIGELKATDLLPFLDASRAHVESIMTAHVIYPILDPHYPATLSRLILTDLLRENWGYGGVVFSDDLEMKAIANHYSLEESVALAVEAGIDVLLVAHDVGSAGRAFEFLCRQSEKDSQVRLKMAESYRRITDLKRRYLRFFAGVNPEEFERQAGIGRHREIVARIQGSL